MALGMTQEEFWHGPPRLVETYRKLAEIKREEKNEEAWWQGVYFYKAIDTIAYNLTKEKGAGPISYPDKPLRIKPYTEDEKEEMAQKEREKAVEFFRKQVEAWRIQHGR